MYGKTIEYRATFGDVLLKWLSGSSVKLKYSSYRFFGSAGSSVKLK